MGDQTQAARSVPAKLGWVRIFLALLSIFIIPLFIPGFARHRWWLIAYLVMASLVQVQLRRGQSPTWRRIASGFVDFAVMTFGIHCIGTSSPVLVSSYMFIMMLYPLALGMRHGMIVVAFAALMLSGTVGLEVLGVLPYAPDSVEWARSAPWTVPRGLAFIVLFSTLGISAGALVGRVVDDLRAERKLNQELLAKLVIGNYQLERIIGQGGMGQVWEAIDRRDQARVALKFLSAGAHRSEAARSRFMREMRLAATIDHPHVVALRDAFEMDDGIPVMVMDLLVGETLATRLAREGKLSLGEAARILLPVVSAVGRAHELGIIHRDLKPENIFLQKIAGKPEHPMVLDFGVAKHAERERAEETAALTETGVTVGTPAYMAPEQAFGERDLDHRLDVWALGVILYECLAGVRPFDSDNRAQLFRALMFEEAMPIAERCPGLPADVAALVGKMLARQRDRRLSDLREVRDVLSVHATTRSPSFGPPISARRLEKTTEVAPPPEDADTEPESAKAQGQAELDRG